MTNKEKIQSMSTEELAVWIHEVACICPYKKDVYDECKFGWHIQEQTCEECIYEWLESKVEEWTI